LIVPAVVGASAATLAQFMPGVAFAASHQASQHAANTEPGSTPDAAGHPSANATPDADTGCTAASSPDYGCGKITVGALPVASTFPPGTAPDVSGLTFEIEGPVVSENAAIDGASATCTTGDTTGGNTDADACPESYGGLTESGHGGAWVAGGEYVVTLDTESGSATAPPGALIPPVVGLFKDCTKYQNADPGTAPSGCADLSVVRVYGTYHRIGLRVVNSVTHKGVPKATYELCSATASAPATGAAGCPSGSTVLETAKTNSLGKLAFKGLYLGSPNYSFALTHAPTGFTPTGSQPLHVPNVVNATEAGALFQGTTPLTPTVTTVTTHHVSTSRNKSVTFNALAGAKQVVKPLTVVKVGKARHGKVSHTKGKITYTPNAGFVGKDVFTYTVRNGDGVKVTGTVIVHVKA
jgi:hypothetical protein